MMSRHFLQPYSMYRLHCRVPNASTLLLACPLFEALHSIVGDAVMLALLQRTCWLIPIEILGVLPDLSLSHVGRPAFFQVRLPILAY